MRQKAKKPVVQQSIIDQVIEEVKITGMQPEMAERWQQSERRSLQLKLTAIDEATAVLRIVAGRPIHPGMLDDLRTHLKASPLSPEGAAMTVLMAEDRGRSRRGIEAGSGRHGNAKEYARKRWDERTDNERLSAKIAFARTTSAEIAERFKTANGSPLAIREETVARWFEST